MVSTELKKQLSRPCWGMWKWKGQADWLDLWSNTKTRWNPPSCLKISTQQHQWRPHVYHNCRKRGKALIKHSDILHLLKRVNIMALWINKKIIRLSQQLSLPATPSPSNPFSSNSLSQQLLSCVEADGSIDLLAVHPSASSPQSPLLTGTTRNSKYTLDQVVSCSSIFY